MTDMIQERPADWREREKAVDITRSCIVQAPAGSGKTELLVQRLLSLLAVADAPEEILAITFTRKAAGEMKLRLLQALESARDDQQPAEPHAAETWRRARVVLHRDRTMAWQLLHNPSRLQLTTIDSFCAFLTRRMPWLARFGDPPGVTDDPAELYRTAATSLLAAVESGGQGQRAIECLLVHLDNRMPLLRDLIVAMLGRRDQWLRHLLPHRVTQPRELLEDGLQLYVSAHLQQTAAILGAPLCQEMYELGRFAAENLRDQGGISALAALLLPRDPASRQQWLALAHLVLTAGGEVRKSVNKTLGFPAGNSAAAQEMKRRVLDLLEQFRDNPAQAEPLQSLRKLPATQYDQAQWQVLEALIELLPLAVFELQEVFRARGQVDFIEVAGAAHAALGTQLKPEELLLQLDSRIRHILVDEFQDTSYAQYDLLRHLTAGWSPGDGRTLFVVGDPMQSIYRFREAEVGLFLRVCRNGLDSLPMEKIVLSTNFRSGKSLVAWSNQTFDTLFPALEDEMRGAVCFSPATAFAAQDAVTVPVSIHSYVGRQDEAEAAAVVKLIRQAQRDRADGRTAVLVRSRRHLEAIVAALKHAGIRYQAQDIDPLSDRPVAQDIVSLARALMFPADRVAWLSVLRAPWCGLTLDDLTALCGADAKATVWQLLTTQDEQAALFDAVSDAGRQRLDRIVPVLGKALANRGRYSLRRLVESAWLALNGPACLDEAGLQDATQVFALLDEYGHDDTVDGIEEQLEKLYAAPDPSAGPELQLMTIHKAKGLEFDTVILPGLGRGIRSRERTLLRWLEHPDYELLLAPIPPYTSEAQEPTYQAIGEILKEKDDLEVLRLLYVAATRAKTRLHLLGHVRLNRDNLPVPLAGSLLAAAWPVLGEEFAARAVNIEEETPAVAPSWKLRRLPADWQPPQLAATLAAPGVAAERASHGAHYREETISSRRTEEGRAIGTVVHLWLELIAGDGPDQWSAASIRKLSVLFMQQLSAHGVPQERLKSCAAAVETCLTNTLDCDRGRWLLTKHQDAQSELAINGLIDGTLIRATIDRTFIDEEGLRWVVDYKTSRPAQDLDVFLLEEKSRYQDQLQVYLTLIRNLYPEQTARAALYFPMCQGWIVIDS